MVVKCPNCGQQVRGEPGMSGPCPKCGTRFTFPAGDSQSGEPVKCPHCGQMQVLSLDRKCIKCRRDMPAKITTGIVRKCPYCGNLQNGGDICKKCKMPMRQPLKISPFAVGVILFFLLMIFALIYIGVRDGEVDITLILLLLFPLLLFGGLASASIFGSFERAGKFIEGDALKQNQRNNMPHEFFVSVNGLDGGIDGGSCTVYIDQEDRNIIFKMDKDFERILPFSQVLDVKIVSQTREVNKSVLGRAAVGAMVAGPVGAIVGGMSGNGSKTVKEPEVFEIEYCRRDTSLVKKIYLRSGKIAPHGFMRELRVAVGLDSKKIKNNGYTNGRSDYL